ncbi:MAG TPA: GWxTD domain-containing protein [Gemmatimonadales bacterium]|nr:GWxTD domain-containing protein [Gemmatimonadales bacterium]
MYRVTLAALALLGLTQVPAPAAPDLAIGTVRFYRADGNRTMVKAFVEIPYAALQSGAGALNYRVTMKVTDSSGLTLANQSWTTPVPAELAAIPGASGMEVAEFPTTPGRYRLVVGVEDSASGRRLEGTKEIVAFASMPEASDLLLSPSMRQATEADTVPRPGELRRGNTMYLPTAHLRLQPLPGHATAYYLMEVYTTSAQEQPATMSVAVVDTAGKALVQTPDQTVRVAPGGGVLKGSIDLEGLPSGDYEMRMKVTTDGHTITRTAPFTMGSLQVALARDTVRRRAESVSDEGYFGNMGETGLDSAYAPLLYIARSGELKPWTKELSTTGKRNFLTQFWQKRDPTPGTARNEAREQFYGAIDYANREYRDRGTRAGSTPGWRTDRGRIYAKNGAPDDVYSRPQELRAPAYILWRYTRDRYRYYLFADRTGVGNYSLIFTNDRGENSLPTWRDIMGREAVVDIGRYLGVDLMNQP